MTYIHLWRGVPESSITPNPAQTLETKPRAPPELPQLPGGVADNPPEVHHAMVQGNENEREDGSIVSLVGSRYLKSPLVYVASQKSPEKKLFWHCLDENTYVIEREYSVY